MIVALIAGGAAVAGVVAYLGVKYHTSAAILAAVNAEITKIEAELAGTEASVAAKALAIVAAIKSKL